ncbi:MAG TPA: PQQ-binding-like beta-propeller repeat protein, partial [Candidatus Thermoplasmatota archaeon]|nr:PQQ-binding-like beta-propeller repeat protein [Candidatus Thermoplasmatota archaeon]
NDIYRLKYADKEYAERSSRGPFFSYVVQHFRFKVDIDPDAVDKLYVLWTGTADASARVDFYFYNNSYFSYLKRGAWELLPDNIGSSGGSPYSLNNTIHGSALKYAIDGNNYIDICAVATHPLIRQLCTLSTDFISLVAVTEKGYSLVTAIAETTTDIVPSNISTGAFNWDLLTWDDYQPTGSEARYQVLFMNATGKFVEVEESALPGNHKGFRTAPVYLNNLSNYDYHTKYNKLKIRVNISTDSPSVSPRIFNWALTWQNKTRWQDSFETYYRIDSRTKVNKVNGTIMLSSVQDEWPMFGFDAANTRASGGKAATSANLYWFGGEYVGGEFRNPVIGNGNVYIFSNGRTLHQYPVILPSGAEEGAPRINTTSITLDQDVVNSPAVTDDLVIVATGQKAKEGSENFIYGYELNNLNRSWVYDYNQKICYDASPVIDGSWLFITTWGGDNKSYVFESQRYTNNKLLALQINTESAKLESEYSLPAPSFSSPAVTSEKIIVTCSSTDNESVIALSRNGGSIGEKIWGKTVGAVGHASPVIYEDTVFVTCAQVTDKKYVTKIVAMNINDGTILWNKTLGTPSSSYSNVAESTPAVYNGVLYAASADGTVYALDTVNGTTLWSKEIYTVPLFSDNILRSSPAYAENHVYIGTPGGLIYALDASTGNPLWDYETFPIWTAAPVLGSPAVSNGLVFIADENGVLYSLGRFTTSTKQVSGRIISVPIRLPEALWWDKFYADNSSYNSSSSISFKLLDENGNVLNNDLKNRSSLTQGGLVLGRAVRLQADFSSTNLSRSNPKLFRWYLTLTSDTQKPFLNSSSFTPSSGGWLQEIVPVFTIKVKDNGTGLRVKSAVYTLEYTLNNVSQRNTYPAVCTGDNGTNAWQTLTMNISKISNFDNITSLRSIMFNITDLAGNAASKTVTFKQDKTKPTSLINKNGMSERYNSTNIQINATAKDNGTVNVDASGVKLVELYYRYSQNRNFSGDWVYFSNSTKTSPMWLFNFTNRPSQHGGYFELCTIAYDYANNNESFPSTGDVWFLYDWKEPELPSYSGDTLWFKERPQLSVVFEDDYRLDTIRYRPSFDTIWTTLASDVNMSVYNTDAVGNTWVLSQADWDQMVEDEIYYLYFRINDTLGNTLEILNDDQAITIRKDTLPPLVSIDVPSVEDEWSMSDNFTVSGLGSDHDGSGIKEASLYYRFSEDKSNWSSWTPFGDMLDSSPFEWEFDATEGDGYYEMKIMATDYAGNEVESEVFPLAIASFPMTLALVLVGLVTVLLLLSVIIYLKWRKKETA